MSARNYFEKRQLIRFHHCDPAGIVFYPEYLVIIDELIEDWFTEGMKTSFAELHARERIGIPAARIEVDFLSPSKIGDVLCLRLFVTRIGNKSFTLMVEASVEETVRLRAVLVRVVASLDGLRGIPIPDALREKLQPYFLDEVRHGREPSVS
ncbi:MAG: acyl-CoA thioesterase [Rhodocyclales bacterium]|nr:acyl-CoA thioesterase [Rhodocyclales bacterium]